MKDLPPQIRVCPMVFLVLLALVLFGSCVPPGNKVGSLSITSEGSKTFAPPGEEIIVVSYRISGVCPDTSASFGPLAKSSISTPVVINDLVVGTWSVSVDGLNEAGEVVTSKTVEVAIRSGETTSTVIRLEPLSGNGIISVSISWPSSVSTFTRLRGIILGADGVVDSFEKEVSTASVSDGTNTVSARLEGIPTGFLYDFKLEFLDVAGNLVGLSPTESLHLYKDRTTSIVYSFPQGVFPVETPVISPSSASIPAMQEISISCATSGAKIYYTVDGADPTEESLFYDGPFLLQGSATVKALAVKDGLLSSAKSERSYVLYVADPSFSVSEGTYGTGQSVELSTSTSGAKIYYTLDGSTPTSSSTLYSEAVTVGQSLTLKALAAREGAEASNVVSKTYTILGKSSIQVLDFPQYSLSMQLPDGWVGNTVLSGSGGTISVAVSPQPPATVRYSWYLDGALAKNNAGEIASTSSSMQFGIAMNDVPLLPGPHLLRVKVQDGDIAFSEDAWIIASESGSVGTLDSYEIGEISPTGGIVFYDDEDDGEDNLPGVRYLEVAPHDLRVVNGVGTCDTNTNGYSSAPVGAIFGYYRTDQTGAALAVGTSLSLGTGLANTQTLVAAMLDTAYTSYDSNITTASSLYAAKLCWELSYGGEDDWFLPAKDELKLLCDNLMPLGLGNLSTDQYNGNYWTSSEPSSSWAWVEVMRTKSFSSATRGSTYRVRPIRAF